MNIDEILNVIKVIVKNREDGIFVPILESDLHGYIYHKILKILKISTSKVHIDSRVLGAPNNTKYDIVIGEVRFRSEDKRPAIKSEVLMEVKIFPKGFASGQLWRRFDQVINKDIPKLVAVTDTSILKIEFIYDEVDYLSGKHQKTKRLDYLCNYKQRKAPNVHLAIVRKDKYLKDWQILVK